MLQKGLSSLNNEYPKPLPLILCSFLLLTCPANNLSEIDVSNNINLELLHVAANDLTNLDLANKILILDVLKNIPDLGVGLLITSHDLEFIKQASDNAYMIKNGEILNRGSSKEIIVRENIKQLFGLTTLPEWVS